MTSKDEKIMMIAVRSVLEKKFPCHPNIFKFFALVIQTNYALVSGSVGVNDPRHSLRISCQLILRQEQGFIVCLFTFFCCNDNL